MATTRRQRSGNPTGVIELKKNPFQEAFLEAVDQRTKSGAHAFHRLGIFAGRRGGKTKIGAVASARKMRQPNGYGWICAPTYPDLYDFIIPEVLRIVPDSWIHDWREQHYELELKNKHIVAFRSLDDPDKARGPGLDWAWLDESRKISQRAWETMLPALTDKHGQAWITTSPNGFDWNYDRFWMTAKTGRPGYWAIKYKTIDNPIYQTPEGRAELEDARASMDPLFYQQEFEADFVTFQGAVFGGSVDAQILRTAAQIKAVFPDWPTINPELEAYGGLDPGNDHPFGAVLGVKTPKGRVYIGEYLGRYRPISEHVSGLHRMLSKWNPDRPFHPTMWAIDKSQRWASIELAQPPWNIFTTPAPNAVEDGIRRVQGRLARRQIWFLLPEGEPELGVPQLVEQMRGYRWADNTAPDGSAKKERVVKRDDDLVDPVRYIEMADTSINDEPEQESSVGKRDLSAYDALTRYEIEEMRRRDAGMKDLVPFAATDSDVPGLLGPDDGEPMGNFWA